MTGAFNEATSLYEVGAVVEDFFWVNVVQPFAGNGNYFIFLLEAIHL
jgi:hypothetical protein